MRQRPSSSTRHRRAAWRWALAAAVALSAWLPAARAEEPPVLTQFHHTAWTRKDGAPAPVVALAQTADGWLWLGTPTGLYRFDGVQFERYPGVTRSIVCLLALPAGGLWMGYVGGGAALLRDGALTEYGSAHGLPARSVQALALDARGRVWASAVEGLYRFDGVHWEAVPAAGNPPLPTLNVVADGEGGVWARSGESVVRVRPGAATAEVVAPAGTEVWLAAAPDGSVWTSPPDDDHGIGRLAPKPVVADGPQRTGSEIYFDHEGRLWSSVDGGVRMSGPLSGAMTAQQIDAALDRSAVLTMAHGFTGRSVIALAQDREGTVWTGTERGLDRLRPAKIQPLQLADAAAGVVVTGADGSVWVGRWNSPPVRVDGPARRELPAGPGSARGPRICGARDSQGAVWLCARDNLWRIERGEAVPVPYPDELPLSLYVQALAADGKGTVWLSTAAGMFRRAQGAWQRFVPAGVPPALGVPNALAVEGDGRLLLGYAGNQVAVLQGGQPLQMLSAAQGLQVGDVRVVTPAQGRFWVGGSRGVALCQGARCRTVALARHAELNGVSGIVESRRGELWLNGAEGITRVAAPALQALLRELGHEAEFQRFDAEDGLDGAPMQTRPMATAAEGEDGRLWFTTSTNVYVVDPARLPRNAVPPPVLIRQLRAGDRAYGRASGLSLPQGTKDLSIAYTALSLSIPDRVRFRYRLSGVDDDWRDAGRRREAFYTNLAPGRYRFTVIAANPDGVWNDVGASLDFAIEPAFHQTSAFHLVVGTLVAALAYALYAWRMHVANARTRQRLEARMAERERIARDLHDTLLQGMHAVALRLHGALLKVPAQQELHATLSDLSDLTEQVIGQGRDRVRELRESGTPVGLVEALGELGRLHAGEGPGPRLEVQALRPARDLHPVVRDELLHIAGEAIANAMTHARARRIDVTLEYGERELKLVVRDDGCGIEPEVLQAGFRPGHWGLVGMRERAAKIDAGLDLRAGPQAGTTVELRVPSRVAYLRPRSVVERLRGWRGRA